LTLFVFTLAERKNEQQKKEKYRVSPVSKQQR